MRWEKPSKNPNIVRSQAYPVQELGKEPTLQWQTILVRAIERGYLEAKFARYRVWAVYGTQIWQEWLLIHQDSAQITYALSNAAEDLHWRPWPGARPIAT
jgi:hypothetical protein